jgi:hypothetical protein
MPLRAPDGYSYPSAAEALRRTKKAIEKKQEQKRKDHYDTVFEEILDAAQKGDKSARLEEYQIEEFGMREHLEKKGYRIGEPFSRHSSFAGGQVTFYYVHWGEETDETV